MVLDLVFLLLAKHRAMACRIAQCSVESSISDIGAAVRVSADRIEMVVTGIDVPLAVARGCGDCCWGRARRAWLGLFGA